MKISPIAEYLRINKAIAKRDNTGCHFISPEGLYLGRLKTMVVNNYRVITLETFGEGFKKMYTKSIAFGQQYIYAKNLNSPIGVSVIPTKTYMRNVYVDFIEGTNVIKDSEKTLANKLDLIAVDETTGVGIYDLNWPLKYNSNIQNEQANKLKRPLYKYTAN